jgi:Enoyl-(Acyl carrier protein) reductase
VKGLLFTVQKALSLLPDGASIILNASVGGNKGRPANGVYSATKAAVRSFARTWTMDLKDRHIRVNAVSPGVTETSGLTDLLASTSSDTGQQRLKMANSIPLGRFGTTTLTTKEETMVFAGIKVPDTTLVLDAMQLARSSLSHDRETNVRAQLESVIRHCFRTNKAIRRHLDAPLVNERVTYLQSRLERGVGQKSTKDTAELLLHVISQLAIATPRQISRSELLEAGTIWAQQTLTHRPAVANKYSARRFFTAGRGWLRFHGLYNLPELPPGEFSSVYADFIHVLKNKMGYQRSTSSNTVHIITSFFPGPHKGILKFRQFHYVTWMST